MIDPFSEELMQVPSALLNAATMRFRTSTGSIYETDPAHNRIRRLEGTHDPTPRQGPDGEWKEYTDISSIEVGRTVLIVWRYEDGVAKSTETSLVKEFL